MSADDPRQLLRAAIVQCAKRTGRLNCAVVVDDLAGMIGEIFSAAEYDAHLEEIAEAVRRRIIEAAHCMTDELRRDLGIAAPLGGRH